MITEVPYRTTLIGSKDDMLSLKVLSFHRSKFQYTMIDLELHINPDA